MYHALVPLLFFLVGYKLFGFIGASGCMCASSIVLISYDLFRNRKVQGTILFTTAMSSIVFLTSAITDNPNLIKMKPTIINIALAFAMSIALIMKKNPIKGALGPTLKMSDDSWNVLARRWIALFVLLAITNEVIRHNYSDSLWLFFKIFGIMIINIIFIVMQIPFIKREMIVEGGLTSHH